MTLAPPIRVTPGSCACSRDGSTCVCAPADLDERLAALTEAKLNADEAAKRGDHEAAARHRDEQQQHGSRLRAALTAPAKPTTTRKDDVVAKQTDVPWVALAERLRGTRDTRAIALADRVAVVATPLDGFRYDGIEYDELIAIGDDAAAIAGMPSCPLPAKLVGSVGAAHGRAQVLIEQATWQLAYDEKVRAKRAEAQMRVDAAEARKTREDRAREDRARRQQEQWLEPLKATTHVRHLDGVTREEREEQMRELWKAPLESSEKGIKKP